MTEIYVVRAGDTLGALAKEVGATLADILNLNPQITNPNLIVAGQPILLPKAPKGLHKAMAKANNPSKDPAWLKIALREEGVAEMSGDQHTARILEYLQTCEGLSQADASKDETAWCSAFACWVMEQDGRKSPRTAWAKSWKDWGKQEPADKPRRGAVAVFSRKSASTNGGHVGFFLEDLGDKIALLGGNQSNRVKISNYPKDGVLGAFSYKLLSYRWPD